MPMLTAHLFWRLSHKKLSVKESLQDRFEDQAERVEEVDFMQDEKGNRSEVLWVLAHAELY